ncbi:MAG: 16S rRNA processing protein RimM [Reichenbachiella sp.]
MKVDDCYQLGYVIKTHGLKGEIQLHLDVDDPFEYQELESMFVLKNQTLIPFFLERIQINGKKAIAKIEEIDSIEEASDLVASEIYLPESNLPALADGQYYFHQLIGMKVVERESVLGTVDQVYEIPPQNLISLIHQQKEVLIPINDDIIKNVDLDKKEILVELPDGLLAVFLEDNEN